MIIDEHKFLTFNVSVKLSGISRGIWCCKKICAVFGWIVRIRLYSSEGSNVYSTPWSSPFLDGKWAIIGSFSISSVPGAISCGRMDIFTHILWSLQRKIPWKNWRNTSDGWTGPVSPAPPSRQLSAGRKLVFLELRCPGSNGSIINLMEKKKSNRGRNVQVVNRQLKMTSGYQKVKLNRRRQLGFSPSFELGREICWNCIRNYPRMLLRWAADQWSMRDDRKFVVVRGL